MSDEILTTKKGRTRRLGDERKVMNDQRGCFSCPLVNFVVSERNYERRERARKNRGRMLCWGSFQKLLFLTWLSFAVTSARGDSVEPALDETNLGYFDQIVSELASGELDPLRAETTRWSLSRQVARQAGDSFENVSPTERAKAARELLGGERYDHALQIFMENLVDPRADYRSVSASYLGMVLGATQSAPALVEQVDFEGLRMFGDLPKPDGYEFSFDALFASAEALAYLRNPTLINSGLLEILLETDPPPAIAARIIRAMAYAGVPDWENIVKRYFYSPHPVEALAAFRVFRTEEELWRNYANELMEGIRVWIPRLRERLEEKGRLDQPYANLLSTMSVTGSTIHRDVGDIDVDLSDTRIDLVYLTENTQSLTRSFVLSLFRFLDNTNQVHWFSDYLSDDNDFVRRRVLYVIAKTVSPDVIAENADLIFPLLDDPSSMVQGFAVYVLQSGLEWPAANLYSERELKEAKEKVLEAYAEIGVMNEE